MFEDNNLLKKILINICILSIFLTFLLIFCHILKLFSKHVAFV